MRAAVYTLGCKLNQCESEALASSFDSRGFFICSARDHADLYIINTCTVTSKAEQKARRIIRKLSADHPRSAILVTGCYAQLNGSDLGLGPNVIVVEHDRKAQISRLPDFIKLHRDFPIVESVRNFFYPDSTEPEEAGPFCSGLPSVTTTYDPDRFWYESVDFSYHTRAFLKIQDGCDNSCSFCRVTIARGSSTSLNFDSLCRQFEQLIKNGYREIVLTGVNLTAYNYAGVDFSRMLSELVLIAENSGREPGIPSARIRISSLEPETIDDRMLNALGSRAICPHFHISVQSGSNRILKLMRRRNTREQLIEAVSGLRSIKDNPFLAADVIAGFPGESGEDFKDTLNLLEESEFAHLHVFPFSPRPGTIAADMKNPVPERIIGDRTGILRDLSLKMGHKYGTGLIGSELEVLLEEKKEKIWAGTSENYVKCFIRDIINRKSGVCRVSVDAFSGESADCSFLKWL